MTDRQSPLLGQHLTLGYDNKIVARDLSVAIPGGSDRDYWPQCLW